MQTLNPITEKRIALRSLLACCVLASLECPPAIYLCTSSRGNLGCCSQRLQDSSQGCPCSVGGHSQCLWPGRCCDLRLWLQDKSQHPGTVKPHLQGLLSPQASMLYHLWQPRTGFGESCHIYPPSIPPPCACHPCMARTARNEVLCPRLLLSPWVHLLVTRLWGGCPVGGQAVLLNKTVNHASVFQARRHVFCFFTSPLKSGGRGELPAAVPASQRPPAPRAANRSPASLA